MAVGVRPTLNGARPLEPDTHEVGFTIGGPMFEFGGGAIPVPSVIAEGRSGVVRLLDRPLDLNYGVNLTGLPFGLLQIHLGSSWLLAHQNDGVPAVSFSKRLFFATNVLGAGSKSEDALSAWGALQFEFTVSWLIDNQLIYVALAEYLDFGNPELTLTPALGAQFDFFEPGWRAAAGGIALVCGEPAGEVHDAGLGARRGRCAGRLIGGFACVLVAASARWFWRHVWQGRVALTWTRLFTIRAIVRTLGASTCEETENAWDKVCKACDEPYDFTKDYPWFEQTLEAGQTVRPIDPAHITPVSVATEDGEGTLDAYFIASHGEDAALAGITVVYNHGNYAGIEHYLPRIRFLYEAGYNVFVWDYRGYGKSLPASAPNADQWLADARQMREVADEHAPDASRVIVYANSVGGIPAVEMAVHRASCALFLEAGFTSLATVTGGGDDAVSRGGVLLPGGLRQRRQNQGIRRSGAVDDRDHRQQVPGGGHPEGSRCGAGAQRALDSRGGGPRDRQAGRPRGGLDRVLCQDARVHGGQGASVLAVT